MLSNFELKTQILLIKNQNIDPHLPSKQDIDQFFLLKPKIWHDFTLKQQIFDTFLSNLQIWSNFELKTQILLFKNQNIEHFGPMLSNV